MLIIIVRVGLLVLLGRINRCVAFCVCHLVMMLNDSVAHGVHFPSIDRDILNRGCLTVLLLMRIIICILDALKWRSDLIHTIYVSWQAEHFLFNSLLLAAFLLRLILEVGIG